MNLVKKRIKKQAQSNIMPNSLPLNSQDPFKMACTHVHVHTMRRLFEMISDPDSNESLIQTKQDVYIFLLKDEKLILGLFNLLFLYN